MKHAETTALHVLFIWLDELKIVALLLNLLLKDGSSRRLNNQLFNWCDILNRALPGCMCFLARLLARCLVVALLVDLVHDLFLEDVFHFLEVVGVYLSLFFSVAMDLVRLISDGLGVAGLALDLLERPLLLGYVLVVKGGELVHVGRVFLCDEG